MGSRPEPVVRDAEHDDVAAICRFGETHVGAAVAEGLVVVAEAEGQLVGVGQRGRRETDHVVYKVYKLYVHPQHRGRGLGPQLLDALTRQLPANADRLHIEHFVVIESAGAFHEREGFAVERIEPSPTEDPALGVVWRARHLAPIEQTSGQA